MKNSLRRIAALLMAVMMLAALGMSVSAATTFDGTDVVGFTLKLTKEGKAYAPSTTYTFAITGGTAVTGSAGVAAVKAGSLDQVAFIAVDDKQAVSADGDTLTITSAPADSDINNEELSYAGKIKIDTSKYSDPGIYRYVVTQTTAAYAGMTIDAAPRTLDVYIKEKAEGGFEVLAAVLYTGEGAAQVKDGVFTNDYDTADLTVSKTVTGNMGDTNMDFSFTIQVDGATGEKYYVVRSDGATVAALETGVSATILLKHGQNFVVYGLSATDSYTVTEDDVVAEDGYTTKVSVNGTETTAYTSGKVTVEKVTDGENEVNQSVAFTNDKNVTVPTGIAMTILPFVAMVLIAAVVAVLFFKKRERREA